MMRSTIFLVALCMAGSWAFQFGYKNIQNLDIYKDKPCIKSCGDITFYANKDDKFNYSSIRNDPSKIGFSTATFSLIYNLDKKDYCGKAFLTCAAAYPQNRVVIGYTEKPVETATKNDWIFFTDEKTAFKALQLDCNNEGKWALKDVNGNSTILVNEATLHCIAYKAKGQ